MKRDRTMVSVDTKASRGGLQGIPAKKGGRRQGEGRDAVRRIVNARDGTPRGVRVR